MCMIIIALGANIPGRWGQPRAAVGRAIEELRKKGVRTTRCSRSYLTRPIGRTGQSAYVNAVALATTSHSPRALLHVGKCLEREAGRVRGPVNGPRPRDIDIIDYAGRRRGWPPGPRSKGTIILPHPQAHRRAFVLGPLLEIAPHWIHPVLEVSARVLLWRLTRGRVTGDLRLCPDPATHGRDPLVSR